MELDELKERLNNTMQTSGQPRSADDLSLLLKKETMSMVAQLKKSIVLELVITLLFTLGCAVMIWVDKSWAYNIYFSAFGVLSMVFIVSLNLLLRKVDRLTGASPVKENLERFTGIMEAYVKQYLLFTLLLLPACFGFGLWLTYNDPETVVRPLEWKSGIFIGSIMIIVSAGIYYFIKWYMKRLYGNYIQKLKALLKEFDEQ